MADTSISRIAYYLALVGGALMIAFGILGLVESSFGEPFFHWGFIYGSLVTLAAGIVAIIGAKSAGTLVWALVLIIVGIIGGGLGGLLVVLGGIFGLISTLSK